jgi:hypothetical protein
MNSKCDFQPRQIVCLTYQATHLYAEVIQMVESRQVGWFRPLLLADFSDDEGLSTSPIAIDLRSGADLLCPPCLFRPAIDTEIIPLLMQLSASEPPPESDPAAVKRLHQFIQQVWQRGEVGEES